MRSRLWTAWRGRSLRRDLDVVLPADEGEVGGLGPGIEERVVAGPADTAVEGRATVPYAVSWDSSGTRLAATVGALGRMVALQGDLASPLRDTVITPFTVPRSDGTPALTDTALAWRPGGAELAYQDREELLIYSVDHGAVVETGVQVGNESRLCWSHDGRLLTVVSDGEDGAVYEVPTFSRLRRDPTPRFVRRVRTGSHGFAWAHTSDRWAALGPGASTLEIGDASGRVVATIRLGGEPLFAHVHWHPSDRFLVASTGEAIAVVDVADGAVLIELRANTLAVIALAFSAHGDLLASLAWNSEIVIWNVADWTRVSWIRLAREAHVTSTNWAQLAFHPHLPILAGPSSGGEGLSLYRWGGSLSSPTTVDHRVVTAKVVLVGDSGVGKTGLGYRIAHGHHREHASTHGQQFWLPEELSTRRADGAHCEVVLWDLAGQPDYRLIHVLFLADADACLILVDPSRGHHALDAASFWARAISTDSGRRRPLILVAARADRGTPAFAEREMTDFAASIGADHYIVTSALTGDGIETLVKAVKEAVPWDAMPLTVETPVLAAVRERLLHLKETGLGGLPVASAAEVSHDIVTHLADVSVAQAEIEATLRQLEVRGYLAVLRDGAGERVVLLAPELLNNLAASLILEARRNDRGLGAVDEAMVSSGSYVLSEVRDLPARQRRTLADAVVSLLIERHVCFRESLGATTLLVFPELINERPPALAVAAEEVVDDRTYVITGDITNVYAALVVLLGYTNVLTRVDQWKDRAQYDFSGHALHFRQTRPDEDRLEIVLAYGVGVPESVRRIFEGLVEHFVERQPVQMRSYPRVDCPSCGYTLPRNQIVQFVDEDAPHTFCPRGGHLVELRPIGRGHGLTSAERSTVTQEGDAAGDRTMFSIVLTQFKAYLVDSEHPTVRPSCFVSYSWDDDEIVAWVRKVLVPDLRQAGVEVILDVAENSVGDSLTRYVERADSADTVLVVGSPDYCRKYLSAAADRAAVVAAEADLIARRLLGTEKDKRSVLPVLARGEADEAFPPLIRTRIHADMRSDASYFGEVFGLVRSLFGVPAGVPAIDELSEVLDAP